MKSNTALRYCIGAALVASAFGAQAAVMTLSSYKYGNGNSVNVTAPAYSGGAGGFTGTLSGTGDPALDGVIDTFCVELGEYFNWNVAYSDYGVVNAVSYFGGDKADKLAKLFSYVTDTGLFAGLTAAKRDDQSTAMQLAVWNIKYDTDLTLDSGSFFTNNPQTWSSATVGANGFLGANQLLANSQSATVTQSIYVLQSLGNPGHQDQIFSRRVPEPEGLTLAMLAFAAAGVATTRRRSRA